MSFSLFWRCSMVNKSNPTAGRHAWSGYLRLMLSFVKVY